MSPQRLRSVSAALALGIGCCTVGAQPRNDLCAGAPLIGLGAVEGVTVAAAPNGASSCGNSNTSPDVYYRFTAPATCQFEVATCEANTDFDTVVSIHEACPATTSNQVVCNNDGCGASSSQAVFAGTRGTTYTIRVAGANEDFGAFTLIIRQLGRPENDTCARAITLGASGTITGNTTCAMSEGSQSCGDGTSTGSPNLYYRWTAPSDGVATFDTCAGASFHTYLSASTDCPHTNLNLVGCNTVSCAGASTMQFGAVGGASYLIRVGGINDERGSFTLGWAFAPQGVPNDACSGAQPISLGSVRGSTVNASVSANISCFPNSSNDVFYLFRSPVETYVHIDTCSPDTSFDTVLSLHSSCPASDANTIACNDNFCGTGSVISFPARPGVDYIIRVSGSQATGNFVLNTSADADAIVFDPSTLSEFYLLGDNQNISQFRAHANALGSHLAVINSFSENQFVSRSVMQTGNVARSVTIGLSDEWSEGFMAWDNGQNADYTFFAAGQPDNFNGAEDYVNIFDPVTGLWNDYPEGAYRGLFGAAESDRQLYWSAEYPANGHLYLMFKPTSWQGAQARARAMGGNLVSIDDSAENEFVRSTFGKVDLWIGLSDASSEGSFRWADGVNRTYRNFMDGEPSNSGGNEDYVELDAETGEWNDVHNLKAGNINIGIAEIVLPEVIATARGPGGCGSYALLSASSFYPAAFAGYRVEGNIVSIGGAQENEFIRTTFAQPAGGRRIWLNASDLDDEGNFTWLNCDPFTYSNFAPGEPNSAGGNEDYVVMNPSGQWSDVSTLDPGPFFAVIELSCVCDWNADGARTSQDFFEFLTEFFANRADINCDHVTNSQDFFDFLACFFDGCA